MPVSARAYTQYEREETSYIAKTFRRGMIHPRLVHGDEFVSPVIHQLLHNSGALLRDNLTIRASWSLRESADECLPTFQVLSSLGDGRVKALKFFDSLPSSPPMLLAVMQVFAGPKKFKELYVKWWHSAIQNYPATTRDSEAIERAFSLMASMFTEKISFVFVDQRNRHDFEAIFRGIAKGFATLQENNMEPPQFSVRFDEPSHTSRFSLSRLLPQTNIVKEIIWRGNVLDTQGYEALSCILQTKSLETLRLYNCNFRPIVDQATKDRLMAAFQQASLTTLAILRETEDETSQSFADFAERLFNVLSTTPACSIQKLTLLVVPLDPHDLYSLQTHMVHHLPVMENLRQLHLAWIPEYFDQIVSALHQSTSLLRITLHQPPGIAQDTWRAANQRIQQIATRNRLYRSSIRENNDLIDKKIGSSSSSSWVDRWILLSKLARKPPEIGEMALFAMIRHAAITHDLTGNARPPPRRRRRHCRRCRVRANKRPRPTSINE